MKGIIITSLLIFSQQLIAQSILPPVNDWKGKSELLIAKADNPWITPAEKSNFVLTATYNETYNWFKKLALASPLIKIITIGKSAEGRDVFMVIASSEKIVTAAALKNSVKPVLLVQAGIHPGEIDGKDAGMMLLRDIAAGNKKYLLEKVNFLFIPILNVDGHERSSPYNRPNQRGPENMGWRTNAENLNLNRDYAKLDTKEIRAVIKVINEYDPLLYMDIHVTDGVDYQYDITFGGHGAQGYSPNISNWLANKYKVQADKDLKVNGHIPGQLLTAVNDRDFTEGTVLILGEPRFSDAYGDLRHLASILVENHALKPFKQRVLGTYVLLESTLKILANEGQSLKESTLADRNKRTAKLAMKWKVPQMNNAAPFEPQANMLKRDSTANLPDSLELLGINSKLLKSTTTTADYVQWTGVPVKMKVANFKGTQGVNLVSRPKGYYIPVTCAAIIERLKIHGIKMEILKEGREASVEMYRITDAKFQNAEGKAMPFEGHMQVTGTAVIEIHKQFFTTGAAYISTDQQLGDLLVLLLEPSSPDSYFQWGFFPQIFQRTEYIEPYVMEPTIKQMLEQSPELNREFEQKKAADKIFAADANAIFSWFYSKTKYYDDRYLLYPIARAL